MNNLEDWTNRAMEYIHQHNATAAMAIFMIKELEDFKRSGVSVADLARSISEALEKEKERNK
ncbi:MAG TPA: hypothetical protein VK668_01320 [Mucilaginibacter sp.]|nr:hypothetical protein [Mucilaginibacter sp.]